MHRRFVYRIPLTYRFFVLVVLGYLILEDQGFFAEDATGYGSMSTVLTVVSAVILPILVFSPYRGSCIELRDLDFTLPSVYIPPFKTRTICYADVVSIDEKTDENSYSRMILRLRNGKARITSHFCYDRTIFTWGSPDEYHDLKSALKERIGQVSNAGARQSQPATETVSAGEPGPIEDASNDDEFIELIPGDKIEGVEYNMTRGEMDKRFPAAEEIALKILPHVPRPGWFATRKRQEQAYLKVKNLVTATCRKRGFDEKFAGAVMLILEDRSRDFKRVADTYLAGTLIDKLEPGGYLARQFREYKYFILAWSAVGVLMHFTGSFENWGQVVAYLALAFVFFI